MDNPLTVKKADEHGFYFWLAHSRFFRTWWCRCVTFLTSSFCFWIVLKDPHFFTYKHVLQEISVTLDLFQKMKTHVLPIFILLDCQVFGNHLCNNFLMANSCVKIWWTVVWFKFNSPAIICSVSWRSDRTRAFHIVIHFWSWRSARAWFIFNGFTAIWKCLIPLEHLWSQ